MKFTDPKNPYFGGGKLTPQEWVNKELEDMKKQMKKKNFEPKSEEAYGVSKIVQYTIEIAGGGPAAWYEIDVREGEIIGGRWRYAWWGNPEVVEMDGDEAQTVADYFGLYIEE